MYRFLFLVAVGMLLAPGKADIPHAYLFIPAFNETIGVVQTKYTPGPPNDGVYDWDISMIGTDYAGELYTEADSGGPNNRVFAGHHSLNGKPGVFYRLSDLQLNDFIYLTEGDVTTLYLVTDVRRISEHDLSIIKQTNDNRLTLFTCTGDSAIDIDRTAVTAVSVGRTYCIDQATGLETSCIP